MIILSDIHSHKPDIAGTTVITVQVSDELGQTCGYQMPIRHGIDAGDASVRLHRLADWLGYISIKEYAKANAISRMPDGA